MAGAGLGLLLASRMDEKKRMKIGWPLFAIGALSTVPLVIDIVRRMRQSSDAHPAHQARNTNAARRAGSMSRRSAGNGRSH